LYKRGAYNGKLTVTALKKTLGTISLALFTSRGATKTKNGMKYNRFTPTQNPNFN
jgi:hypothetical protein